MDGFCSNCGHRNALGSGFCSSCGAVLISDGPEHTTITFHPITPGDPVAGDDMVDELGVGDAGAALVVRQGPKAGSRFALTGELVTAGRHPDSDIFLDDITVSRRHAELRHGADGIWSAYDAGSLNGTYLNRERIEVAPLRHGDELQIGKFKLVFVAAGVDR